MVIVDYSSFKFLVDVRFLMLFIDICYLLIITDLLRQFVSEVEHLVVFRSCVLRFRAIGTIFVIVCFIFLFFSFGLGRKRLRIERISEDRSQLSLFLSDEVFG